MEKLVTVGIPVYKRLNYLPQALRSVSLQDYPNVELIVSDNGMNGSRVDDIVKENYSKPYRFRQNPQTVTPSTHYNQIVNEASGEYFVLLCDDDELSSNYISELYRLLEQNPRASVAISRQEIIDQDGRTIRYSKENMPELMSGTEFILAWCHNDYNFFCFTTTLARTEDIRSCGAYPDFTPINGADDALLIKLCLNSHVALSRRCTFRYRYYELSYGLSVSCQELAGVVKQILHFYDSDPRIQEFAAAHPDQWVETKGCLVKMYGGVYFGRWRSMYSDRLTRFQWVRAAFVMPFIPSYYRRVLLFLGRAILSNAKKRVNLLFQLRSH
jgi:glycosyltransferase involved in cell wall biosynthesis